MNELLIRSIKLKKDIKEKKGYPFDLPVVRNFSELTFKNNVTIITGENGIGKSTLLEAVAVNLGYNPEGGNKDLIFSTYENDQSLSNYFQIIKTARKIKNGFFLRTETVFNFNTKLAESYKDEYYSYDNHHSSHGEGIMFLVKKYFRENGFYIMDEPETALSPVSQLALLNIINDLSENKGCQFVIATHSPIIAGYPGTLLEINNDGLFLEINYQESMVYNIYKRYLCDDKFRKTIFTQK